MIRNGIYLGDGTMRGGGRYYIPSEATLVLAESGKGEMTSREHSPIHGTYPWARMEISIGFTGTYNFECAEFDATALAGERSFRCRSIYQLLFAD
jgi:hypothetical protein